MKLHQLRFVCEVVDCGFSVSSAALALHTSQPSVSRQIREFETEVGVSIFERSKNRLTGLTRPGLKIVDAARCVLTDCENLTKIAKDLTDEKSGSLTITTSHTHARYVLPSVIQEFIRKYPKVRLSIRQGNPAQIIDWVSSGEADISIVTDPLKARPNLALLPCYEHSKVVLVPKNHPLLKSKRLSIEALADYPLITYESEYSTHWQVLRAFERAGLTPNVVLSATDVDVMKTYVKCGMGIAILAALAYEPREDRQLRAIDARHLFESNKMSVGIRRNSYLPRYAFDFIKMFSPKLNPATVERALRESKR